MLMFHEDRMQSKRIQLTHVLMMFLFHGLGNMLHDYLAKQKNILFLLCKCNISTAIVMVYAVFHIEK
jgi:hypothetical protein